jgi:hypothetical protein
MRPWLGHSLRRNRSGSQYPNNVAWIARDQSLINDFSNRAIAISQVQSRTHQHQETGFFTVYLSSRLKEISGAPILFIFAVSRVGLDELMQQVWQKLDGMNEKEAADLEVVARV